jgi:hypothetical protein
MADFLIMGLFPFLCLHATYSSHLILITYGLILCECRPFLNHIDMHQPSEVALEVVNRAADARPSAHKRYGSRLTTGLEGTWQTSNVKRLQVRHILVKLKLRFLLKDRFRAIHGTNSFCLWSNLALNHTLDTFFGPSIVLFCGKALHYAYSSYVIGQVRSQP